MEIFNETRLKVLCRRAGFRKITLRGETDFTQTEYLDGWDEGDVRFVFGIDAMPNLYELAENLPETAWKHLELRARYEVKTKPRSRPDNVKEQVVRDREFENIRLVDEHVAEFSYRPTKCQKTYRAVVVWKDLEVSRGRQKQFDKDRCFFYVAQAGPPCGTNFGRCSKAFSAASPAGAP